MKRGQLTIFIIVGIVLLFILGFAIYIAGKAVPEARIPDTGPENDPSGCLGRVSRHVLLLTAAGDENEMQIYMPYVVLDLNAYPPPMNINYTQALYDHEYQEFGVDSDNIRFGIYNFDPLCLNTGPNRPRANGNTSSCMGGTYQQWFDDENEVIQKVLSDRINHSLSEANCSIEGPVTVVFGNDDVTVYTKDSAAVVPMRFKRMYNAAARIAQAEIRNLDYNLMAPAQINTCDEPTYNNNCIMSEMEVTVTSGPVHTVSITDKFRKINGEFPVYKFRIQNRYPTITEYPNTRNPSYSPTDITLYSYGDVRPQTLGISSQDPDDEPLTITYEKLWTGDRPSTPERLDEEKDALPPLAIPLSFRIVGADIEVGGIPVCITGRTYTFQEQIYYEACDDQGFCANTTTLKPRIELSTEQTTVDTCCSDQMKNNPPNQYSAYPGDQWCCSNKESVETMDDSDPWKAVCCTQTSFTAACCNFYIDAEITDPQQREACGLDPLEDEEE